MDRLDRYLRGRHADIDFSGAPEGGAPLRAFDEGGGRPPLLDLPRPGSWPEAARASAVDLVTEFCDARRVARAGRCSAAARRRCAKDLASPCFCL